MISSSVETQTNGSTAFREHTTPSSNTAFVLAWVCVRVCVWVASCVTNNELVKTNGSVKEARPDG